MEPDPVENITLLIEKVKKMVDIKMNLLKLDLTEKITRLFYLALLGIILLIILSLILAFLSVTLASWLGNIMGSTTIGFLIVSGLYLLLFFLVILNRKNWILNPILRQVSSIFINNDDKSEF